MSMSLVLALFEEGNNGSLLTNYKEFEEYEIIVTDFVNDLIPNNYIKDFEATEDGEIVILREIDKEKISSLAKDIKHTFKRLRKELDDALGDSKRKELLNKIEDIYLLTDLFREFYRISLDMGSNGTIKILVS